jgi:16S rRNA (guanine527-N7)-methyltransferase
MTPAAALARGIQELQLQLPDRAAEQLLAYETLIGKWNRAFNLTAIRDPLRRVRHHLLDSLAVIGALAPGRLADIGAGAGLPGIPIAVAQPERAVALVESNMKKCAFLRQAAIELRLANVEVHHVRVERWQPATRFDIVICRGYAELCDFIASCRHLLAPGGMLAAMKGRFPAAELSRVPGEWNCDDVRRLHVPQLDAERHLVRCTLRG